VTFPNTGSARRPAADPVARPPGFAALARHAATARAPLRGLAVTPGPWKARLEHLAGSEDYYDARADTLILRTPHEHSCEPAPTGRMASAVRSDEKARAAARDYLDTGKASRSE
jgi:hypothetical protein